MVKIAEIIWQFILEHFWSLLLGFILLFKGGLLFNKLFLEPITGDDGKVAMDEFAKYVLVIVMVFMIYREGATEGNVYDVSVFYAIVLAVVSIAGIKEAGKVLGKYFDNKKE